MILKNGPGRRSLIGLREYRFDTAKPRQLASAQITRMSENTPSPSGGAVPPKPAEASKVQPKQATVRIALPPKPAGGATIHHCRTLHRTLPNHSPRQRRAWVMHYIPKGTFQNGVELTGRPVLRG